MAVGKAGIVTALPVEFDAVCAQLGPVRSEAHPSGSRYVRGEAACAPGWEVWVAETGAGNVAAAAEIERLIGYQKLDVLMFVGIAGGVKDVAVGDVVAATKVYGYHSARAEDELKPRPDVNRSSYRLVELAKQVARTSRLEQSVANPIRILCGPIAAGEQVVASTASETYKLIRRLYSDAIAIEMEGAGCLEAAYRTADVEAVVLRGISDLIDDKSAEDDDQRQAAAAGNAAEVAFAILREVDWHRSEASRATVSRYEPPATVGDADPYELGTTRSSIANRYADQSGRPPYVSRTVADAELDALLSSGRPGFVLVHGRSKAGKTRTLFEALLRHRRTAPILAPSRHASLGQAIKQSSLLQGPPGVVWLDDIDQYLGAADGLTETRLKQLSGAGHLVVGTIRDEILSAVSSAPTRIDQVLDLAAKKVRLEALPDSKEQAAAKELYPGEHINGGLGEHFVAVEVLREKYEVGTPVQRAFVQAVVDAYRVTRGHSPSIELATKLHRAYAATALPTRPVSDFGFDACLEWATEPISSAVSLVAADGQFLRPFDYMVALDDGGVPDSPVRAIPEATWNTVLRVATPKVALLIGQVAWRHASGGDSAARERLLTIAESAFQAATAMDERPQRVGAMLWQAAMLAKLDRDIDAQALLDIAMKIGEPEQMLAAAKMLADYALDAQDIDGAIEAMRQVTMFEGSIASEAWHRIGRLHLLENDQEAAEQAWRKSIDCGSEPHASYSRFHLGRLLVAMGARAEAEAFLRAAAESDTSASDSAAYELWRLLYHRSTDEALAFLDQAAFSDCAIAGRASFVRGEIHIENGDTERGLEFIRRGGRLDMSLQGAARVYLKSPYDQSIAWQILPLEIERWGGDDLEDTQAADEVMVERAKIERSFKVDLHDAFLDDEMTFGRTDSDDPWDR
jgi:nucleoside phosphorylase/tetratricopeptide (TPR) repeat protein